jgi:hypothetical protein
MDYKETLIQFYRRARNEFNRSISFEDTEVTVLINSKPNQLLSDQYIERRIATKSVQALPEKSEHFVSISKVIDSLY